MGFTVWIDRTILRMMYRTIDDYRQSNMKVASTTVLDTEPLVERSLPRQTRLPKKCLVLSCTTASVLDFVAVGHLVATAARSPNRKDGNSICYTESDKFSERGTSRSPRLIDTSLHRSSHSSEPSVKVIKPVNTFYEAALDYRSHPLPDRAQH